METFALLAHGFSVALAPEYLLLALAGCAVGTLVGALPGLGPVNGVALLIPLTFSLRLDPTGALILLASVYYGAMYGGRISSILLNIPGDEPAMMTCLDGHPMALQGRASAALGISAIASFVGAAAATVGLTLFAPVLVKLAIHFGPADYFALYAMAFATIAGIGGGDVLKALLAASLGLMIGVVGLDPASGVARYTLGYYELYDGVDFIAALVGLFAISEFLLLLESRGADRGEVAVGRPWDGLKAAAPCAPSMARGSLVGFVAGVLPGAGASLGSYLAYVLEKRWIGAKGAFGRGDPRGVAAPEAGNNAASGGALVPMLALGIPGSGTTAVLLALLLSLNITPGPLLFEQQPDLVWGLVAALFIGNVMLLALNIPLIGLFTRVLALPRWILMPFVILIAFVGVYSINNNPFDLYLMVGFGVLGYVFRKIGAPVVPVVLGLLLGAQMEFNLRRALSISGGDWSVLWSSEIAVGVYILALALLVLGAVVTRALGRPERIAAGGAPPSEGGTMSDKV